MTNFGYLKKIVWLCALSITLLFSEVLDPVRAQDSISVVINTVEVEYSLERGGYDITAHVNVRDTKGDPIHTLTKSDFVVREDGTEIREFDVVPSTGSINLVLAIDTSGSMGVGGVIQAVKQAATTLVGGLGENDQVGLVSFNQLPEVELDLTDDHAAVRERIDHLEPAAGTFTCLWDSAYEAVENASTAESGRNAVVLLTDGIDERPDGEVCSIKTPDDVIHLATDPTIQVSFYSIGIGDTNNKEDISRIADLTGGQMSLTPNPDGLEALIGDLALQLLSGYTLRYWSGLASGEHNIYVQVDHQGAQDHDVRKFLAPQLPASLDLVGIANGQQIGDQASFTAIVTGSVTPVRVEFYLNGHSEFTDLEAPFEWEWSSEGIEPGFFVVRAVAFGVEDSVIADTEVEAIYIAPDEEPSTTEPSVTISFDGLQEMQTIQGSLTLETLIVNEHLVGSVAFFVDGFVLGEDVEPPFETRLRVDYIEPGDHLVSVVAYDSDGQELAREETFIVYEPPQAWFRIIGISVLVLSIATGSYFLIRRFGVGRWVELAVKGATQPEVALANQKKMRSSPEIGKTLAVLTVEACHDPTLVGQCFEIQSEQVVIGRSDVCEVFIPVQPVSRRHAVLMLREGKNQIRSVDDDSVNDEIATRDIPLASFYIYDGDLQKGISSTYGTFLENVEVQPKTWNRLNDGCRIRLGRPIADGRATPLILGFRDLRKEVRRSRIADLTSDEIFLEGIETEDMSLLNIQEGHQPREIEPMALPQEDSSDELYATETIFREADEPNYDTDDFDHILSEDDELKTEAFDIHDEEGGNSQ